MFSFLFFNDTATTDIYTLSLHDALPIFHAVPQRRRDRIEDVRGGDEHHARQIERDVEVVVLEGVVLLRVEDLEQRDRKSTRLNSSHVEISYAVFCLKKKTK